jgi:ABC-type sugar transport system substrate-binding protein
MKNHSKARFPFLLFGVALAAASVTGQQPKTAPSGTPTPRHIPCAKQIGISPAAMQQRRAIMEAAKAKVQTVCKDESLTPQQKKEQIHQIHQEATQQAEGLIPAAQSEALKKCQHEQAAASSTTPTPRTTGPCGESPEPEDDHTPRSN